MNARRRDVIEACGVSRLVECKLGGLSQKVLVESVRATNPLLVFLHGGPGSPLPFSAGMRGMYPELYDLSFYLLKGAGRILGGHAMDELLACVHAFTGAGELQGAGV